MSSALAFRQCLPSSWNRRLALLPWEVGIAVLSFCLGKEGRVPAGSPTAAAPHFHFPLCRGRAPSPPCSSRIRKLRTLVGVPQCVMAPELSTGSRLQGDLEQDCRAADTGDKTGSAEEAGTRPSPWYLAEQGTAGAVLTLVTCLPAPCPYLDSSALLVPDDAACRLLTTWFQAGLGFPTAAGPGCKGFVTLEALQREWVLEPWRWLGLAEHGFRWLSRWRLHARAD